MIIELWWWKNRQQLQDNPDKWSLDLPGTDFFSLLFQATSSRQMSSIKVLVTTEMPCAPTAEALWDMGTRSATVVSKPTWGIIRSQAEIRSIRRQAKTRLHKLEMKMMSAASAVGASSLYVVWADYQPGQADARATTEEKKIVNNSWNLDGLDLRLCPWANRT